MNQNERIASTWSSLKEARKNRVCMIIGKCSCLSTVHLLNRGNAINVVGCLFFPLVFIEISKLEAYKLPRKNVMWKNIQIIHFILVYPVNGR